MLSTEFLKFTKIQLSDHNSCDKSLWTQIHIVSHCLLMIITDGAQ